MYENLCRYIKVNDLPDVQVLAFGRAMSKVGFTGQNKRRVASGYEYKVYGFNLSSETMSDEDLCLEAWKIEADSEFDDVADDGV